MQETIERAVAEFLVDFGIAHKLVPVRYGDDSVKMEKTLPFTDTREQTVSAMVSVDGGNVLVEGVVEFTGWVEPTGHALNPCGELLGPGWAAFRPIPIPLADPDVFEKLEAVLVRRFTEGSVSEKCGPLPLCKPTRQT